MHTCEDHDNAIDLPNGLIARTAQQKCGSQSGRKAQLIYSEPSQAMNPYQDRP